MCEQSLQSGWTGHDLTTHTWHQQALNDALPAMVDRKAGRVVIARTSVISEQMLDGASHLHPTDVGYQWMAYMIYHALAPWLGHDVGAGRRYMTNIPVPPGQPRPLAIL